MNTDRRIDFRFAPDKSQTCIGLVDDHYKTLVMDDGSLAFDYDQAGDPYYYPAMAMQIYSRLVQNRGFHHRFKPEKLHRDTLVERRQSYGRPEEAIVTTTEIYRHSELEWKCFAWMPDKSLRADVILWKLTAENDFGRTRSGVALYVLGEEPEKGQIVSTAPCAGGSGAGVTFERNGCFLDANGILEGAFFVVHKGELPEEQQSLETAREALCWAENYWRNVQPFRNRFHIPNEEIMEMLSSCGRNMLQAREVHDGIPVYQVGPTCYRGLWIADGLFMLEAAGILGADNSSENGIRALLNRVQSNGSIQAIAFHEKETAIAVFTLVRQCRLMGNSVRLGELWPVIFRAFLFLKRRVEASCNFGEDYPARGLYPPSYGDGGINGLEPEYTTPLWIMAALKAASSAGKENNLAGWTDMETLLGSMLACYRKAYARDRKLTPDGVPYVKTSMLTDEELDEHIRNHEIYDQDGEVCNWGGYTPQCGTWTLAQVISMAELFAEDDPVVHDFLKLLESCDKQECIPQDTGWVTEGAVWGYSSMFYGQAFLYAGRGDKAEEYLYGFANHAAPSRCWREEQALADTQCSAIWGDMPHNWGSAEFIRLVRNMLVLEKGNSLYLLEALSEQWLPDREDCLELEDTPTGFGTVSVKLEKTEFGCQMTMQGKFHRFPDNILIRVPCGFTVAEKVSADGHLIRSSAEKLTVDLITR